MREGDREGWECVGVGWMGWGGGGRTCVESAKLVAKNEDDIAMWARERKASEMRESAARCNRCSLSSDSDLRSTDMCGLGVWMCGDGRGWEGRGGREGKGGEVRGWIGLDGWMDGEFGHEFGRRGVMLSQSRRLMSRTARRQSGRVGQTHTALEI